MPKSGLKACLSLPFSEDDLEGTSRREECSRVISEKIEKRCLRPQRASLGTTALKDCLSHHVYHADEERCALIEESPLPADVRAVYQGRCREAALFRLAHRFSDAEKCGDSPVCRMLMGQDICRRHLEAARPDICRAWSREKVKKDVVAKIDALMRAFEPKSHPGYRLRRSRYEEKLKALRE
jgi:hypothetical protein